MCVILFAVGVHPRYPLIVAANRDEAYDRPAASASFWTDHPHVYGGRDLEHGGTWLGLGTSGRFAAITNYRQGHRLTRAALSRGELTRDYLIGECDAAPYLADVASRGDEYGGYSLIAGTPQRLYFCSNRANGVQPIAPGAHGLSNRLLDEPWPKVQRGIAVIRGLLNAGEATLTHALFELLADTTPAADHLLPSTGIALERERDLSAVFISGESYGTRASTVILLGADGDVLYLERSFGPRGTALGSTERRFTLQPQAKAALPQSTA